MFRVVKAWILLGLIASFIHAQIKTHIYAENTATDQSFKAYLTLGDTVSGIETNDITISNGMVDSITGANRYRTIYLTATAPGSVSLQLKAGAGSSVSNTNQTTLESNNKLIMASFDEHDENWDIKSNEDWSSNAESSTNMDFMNHMATPNQPNATYASITKIYNEKMKAEHITFKQSPVWDNWDSIPNVQPTGAKDAPILLSIADGDYYLFANDNSDSENPGYATWHSTDMVNWQKYRQIYTGPNSTDAHFIIGRWMTSAEYKDGKFYILGDVPNDEDPHLWIDDNLKDDIPATYSETAIFNDPSHGSDASFFRNDGDGLFHIFYEDWTPIKASSHAWDSPLGGHTSSEEGSWDFEHHEHAPVIDHRTTPTGETGTHNHPTGTMTYFIHQPEQDAYGDWTTIKVGSQMYWFADFDKKEGGEMQVVRMTSPSIYETASVVGTLGIGHPDPTVGFAEGKFYLITQHTDFTSPGPWVNQVEARAGVDIDGNGTIENWTDWQKVEETYDHKPGYARVVDVTKAQLDLSSLPEGLGFKFEFRIEDQVSGEAIPIIDEVRLTLQPVNIADASNPESNKNTTFAIKQHKNELQVSYNIQKAGEVKLTLYNLRGELQNHSLIKHIPTGLHSQTLQLKATTKGIHFLRIIMGNQTIIKKCILE